MKKSNIALLKEMFTKMVIEKNASLIPKYYDEDFLLYTNGQTMDYAEFLKMHISVYKTSIQYKISYDEESFVEQDNRIACRVCITTKRENEAPKEIEVILIATFKKDKLHRVWELTYPDWSQLPAFK